VKTVILIFCLTAAWTASGQINQAIQKNQAGTGAFSSSSLTNQTLCCRYPLRTLGGAALVNLTPRFKWWKDGKYVLACFALAVGETKAGVPIYDLGGVDINSP
jgi:hypothetical protein